MEDDGNGPVKYGEMYKDLKGLWENLNEVVFLEAGTNREAPPVGEDPSASSDDEGSVFAQPNMHFGYQPDPFRVYTPLLLAVIVICTWGLLLASITSTLDVEEMLVRILVS